MKQIQIEDAKSSAQVMAEQASIGLQFNDIETLNEITGTVRWKNSLRTAVVVGRDLNILASYPSKSENIGNLAELMEALKPESHEGYHLEPYFVKPLGGLDGIEGFLVFELNNEVLNKTLKDQFKALLLTLLVVPLVASFLIRPWREALIKPIAELSSISGQIFQNYDFSLRAKTDREDELGKMVHSFNRMMEMIQERDRMLQEAKEILADKVDERTLLLNTLNQKLQGELEHRKDISDRLLIAKENAEASDVAKSEFLSVISHEVRTPISGIFGMVQLLQKTQLNENQQEYLEQISSASTRQLRLINNILDLTKMEVGEFPIKTEMTHLRSLVENTARQQAATISRNGLDFFIDYPPELPQRIIVDGHALQQILSNLIGNSTKFTEQGSISIKINLLYDEAPGKGVLILTVEDTGIGIEPKILNDLFEKFTQADSSTSRNYGGTGLGLAICKHLCEIMGGSIRGESQPGQGTHFIVDLPVSIPKDPYEKIDGPKNPLRVWLITPSSTVESLISRQLTSLNLEIYKSQESFLSSQQRDVVMLDLHGKKVEQRLLEQLKELQVQYGTKIVFLTGYVAEDQHPFISEFEEHVTLRRPLIQLEPMLKVFDLKVPNESEQLGDPDRLSPVTSASDKDAQIVFSLRILLVEDDEVNRLFMETMIKEYTGNCHVAHSGLQAIELLKDGLHVDLIIMDCMMPQMDGYEATKWIRNSSSKAKNIPIYALTANEGAKDRQRCYDSGMTGVLSKPLAEKEFLKFLKNLS